jgi:hypothetical protein
LLCGGIVLTDQRRTLGEVGTMELFPLENNSNGMIRKEKAPVRDFQF